MEEIPAHCESQHTLDADLICTTVTLQHNFRYFKLILNIKIYTYTITGWLGFKGPFISHSVPSLLWWVRPAPTKLDC